MYQLFRSLAYIHSLGICHRDIKPQNLLLDPKTGVLKLCDFGSAKHLVRGEPNVSYICSRYYRAPELIFGAIDYTTKIGEWKKLLQKWLGYLRGLVLGGLFVPKVENSKPVVHLLCILSFEISALSGDEYRQSHTHTQFHISFSKFELFG